MKKGWQKKKLDEVCEVEYGIRVVQKRDGGKTYPVYGGGGATFSMDSFNREDRVVVARFGMSEQCTRFVAGKFFLNDSGLTIAPKNLDTLLPAFLDKWLFSSNDEIFAIGKGTAQKNLDVAAFRCLQVPLPPLPEQKRIVAILDKAFAAIAKAKANAEKNLKNARELFDSYLQSGFTNPGDGWEKKKLGEVVKTTQGIQIPKSSQKNSYEKNYKRYLYISDFDHDDNLKYVEDKYPSKVVTEKDLIVVNTGATAGKIHRGIDGVLSNNLFKVSFEEKLLNVDFLYYFVISSVFKDFQKKIVRGTANPHMGHGNFNSTPFYLPSLPKQHVIVAKLDALSAETKKLEGIYQQKLADLEELKKSILQKAFNGELAEA